MFLKAGLGLEGHTTSCSITEKRKK